MQISTNRRLNLYTRVIKRIIDFLISLMLLIVLMPFVLVILLVLLKANKDNGVLFIQKRTGKNGKLFRLIKLKTMNDEKDEKGNLLHDSKRLTRTGKYLRSFSMDEFPQLINVLKGDMSLVGPRPLLEKYLPLYTAEQLRRHEVKPGMTGWAQVNGRNAISWKEKFEYDVWYVDNVSFLLDMKILYYTLKKVIKREGISSANSVTTEVFNGNN